VRTIVRENARTSTERVTMATATMNRFGVFGDEVYTSTDLNRRAGEVLNHARLRPVTISRNNEQFALLRREQAAGLVRAVNTIEVAVEALSALHAEISGVHPTGSMAWVKIYEKDDLQRFCSELLEVTRSASTGNGDWDQVETVIHEWRESASVAASGVIDSALFEDVAEESPLPHPDEALQFRENGASGECQKK
jgi:hypothetical protein